jgi:hypothetical protein
MPNVTYFDYYCHIQKIKMCCNDIVFCFIRQIVCMLGPMRRGASTGCNRLGGPPHWNFLGGPGLDIFFFICFGEPAVHFRNVLLCCPSQRSACSQVLSQVKRPTVSCLLGRCWIRTRDCRWTFVSVPLRWLVQLAHFFWLSQKSYFAVYIVKGIFIFWRLKISHMKDIHSCVFIFKPLHVDRCKQLKCHLPEGKFL